MSNRDFSHVTRVQQRASQNLFAGKVVTLVAQATTPGYIVKGGVPSGSVAIATNIGQAAAGLLLHLSYRILLLWRMRLVQIQCIIPVRL